MTMLSYMLCKSPTKFGIPTFPSRVYSRGSHADPMPLKDCVLAGIKRSGDFVSY